MITMRKVMNINEGWEFIREGLSENVDLPHTWNGIDGQGGADGYYRGRCVYKRTLPACGGRSFVEVTGANTVSEVFVNGEYVGRHINGYSMFRFEITEFLKSGVNVLEIAVDNSPDELLYPQMADFTFYGGIYRDVNIITGVAETNFALLDKSLCGVYITPKTDGRVYIKSVPEGDMNGCEKEFSVADAEGKTVASVTVPADKAEARVDIPEPVLWNGMKNPYLYTLTAKLIRDGEVIDCVSDRFGLRDIRFDCDKGFFLNGEQMKLKGVSRHQDREKIGNALTIKEHAEDLAIIKEIGANSIRLAHYQHDKKFYDLCDEMGFVVWAEIPVISKFSKKKQAQARLMLEELIKQNYNHPSIFCWSIENEISIAGSAPSLIAGISELNNIAHKLDPTRPTASAQVAFSPISSKLNDITDILGYNQYFGWYVQTVEAIDEWLDRFRAERPNAKLCLSEYGAEGVTTLHSAKPIQGDYSEEYQALYHEHYIKAINERDWLWGSYVWNMFDFGSAVRNEGGVRGRNNKGLVTIDRKIRKDAFYVYKSYWAEDKFVHIAGERFVVRPTGEQKIKVYSNCDEVELDVGGKKQKLTGARVFEFDVCLPEGESVITARSGKCRHKITVVGSDEGVESYSLGESGSTFVRNWFAASDEIDPDRLSLNDTLGDIIFNPEVGKLIKNHLGKELNSPLLRPVGKLPLKPIAALASRTKSGKSYVSLANQFLQTIEKEEANGGK